MIFISCHQQIILFKPIKKQSLIINFDCIKNKNNKLMKYFTKVITLACLFSAAEASKVTKCLKNDNNCINVHNDITFDDIRNRF